MDNTKSPKNVSLKNQLELWLFCALIGAVAGALVFMQVYVLGLRVHSYLHLCFPEKNRWEHL